MQVVLAAPICLASRGAAGSLLLDDVSDGKDASEATMSDKKLSQMIYGRQGACD